MVPPQSLLFRAEQIPHYVNLRTRSRVLSVYRRLQRALGRLPDRLARPHLRLRAQHSFAAFKHITDTRKITALLQHAEMREVQWASGAAALDHKDLLKTLELAFTTYKVKETPLKRVLRRPPALCDHSSLVYKFNNLRIPRSRTFAQHLASKSMNPKTVTQEPYWSFTKLLQSNNVRTGANRRKLVFDPEDCGHTTVTVFGAPVALSRQANILRSIYSTLLRDASRPVHPDVIAHVESQLQTRAKPRQYYRRVQHFARELFTLDAQGKMCGLQDSSVKNILGVSSKPSPEKLT